jgi:hypothetical protein
MELGTADSAVAPAVRVVSNPRQRWKEDSTGMSGARR